MKVKLNLYQDKFLFSVKRFPAMIASVGTGKSMMLLLKAWQFAEQHKDSLILIVRKEFTDLRDSTMKDFEKYFGVRISSSKDFEFKNGSVIMFRHGAEMDVLKNMNLSMACIEQAEEFETDETFTFLRDRLRRQNAPYRQLCLIANANGHNWIWRLFIQKAETKEILDEKTGQIMRQRGEYMAIEANTFANEHNLPEDFVNDLRQMKEDAPNHYMRYVMNSHEEVDSDDLLFKSNEVYDAPNVHLPDENRVLKRVMGVDVARFGNDKTVFTIVEQKDLYRWEQVFKEVYSNKDTTWIVGYGLDLERRFDLDLSVIDDVGVGGGVTDLWKSNGGRVLPFIANASASVNNAREYKDAKAEAYFMLEDLLKKGWIKLLNDHDQAEQLMTIRYKFNGALKQIVSKDEMRVKYKELKSPDMAEALAMAVYGTNKRPNLMREQQHNLPKYARTDSDAFGSFEQQYDLPRYATAN